MVKYVFNEFAIEWLKSQNFTDEEIVELQTLVNRLEGQKNIDETIKRMVKNKNPKVDAVISLLASITDAENRPICFEDNGLIDIPDEVREYFDNDLEFEELDLFVNKMKKMKFPKRFSYQKRRSAKKGDRHPEI